MKFANKIKEDKEVRKVSRREEKIMETPKVGINSSVVSFILVAKTKLCFRECAKIVQIAEDTGCTIEIAAGTKSGDSSSILSLVNLEITADKSLVLTIKGERKEEAFRSVSKIIAGTAEES